MAGGRLRGLGCGLAASAGTSLLALTSIINAAFACGDDVTLVLGGTGLGIPNPPPSFIIGGTDKFVTPNFPGFTSTNAHGVYTPEQLYPLTGPDSLTLDQSVAHGVDILDKAILQQLADGNQVTVLTVSQSAVIASQTMSDLAALPAGAQPGADQLSFVLLVDPDNPNGGLFARFPDVAFPALGVTFNGATPPDTAYPTDIYTLEYDGASDYPQYPIDLLADLNALAGFLFVHPAAGDLTPAQIASAIELPTDPAYGTATSYYLVPTENLPLLDPLRMIPVVGNPLADLLQPDLRVIVNLGYGDPDFGYSTGPANVPTPAGFLPQLDINAVWTALVNGAQQGWSAMINDLTSAGSSDPVPSESLPSLGTLGALAGVSTPAVPVPTTIPGDTVGNVIAVLQALTSNTAANLTAALGATAAAAPPLVQVAIEAATTVPSVNLDQVLSAIAALAGGDVTGFVDGIGGIPGEDITFALFGALVVGGDALDLALTDAAALQNLTEGNFDIISALIP